MTKRIERIVDVKGRIILPDWLMGEGEFYIYKKRDKLKVFSSSYANSLYKRFLDEYKRKEKQCFKRNFWSKFELYKNDKYKRVVLSKYFRRGDRVKVYGNRDTFFIEPIEEFLWARRALFEGYSIKAEYQREYK